jgi:hypothetical protein
MTFWTASGAEQGGMPLLKQSYRPRAPRSIRPSWTGGHQIVGAGFRLREGEEGVGQPSSAPDMRRSWASKASKLCPKAVNTRPPSLPSAQGMERRKHEGLRVEAFLSGALDVRRFGSVLQLFVGVPVPPDGVVLLVA